LKHVSADIGQSTPAEPGSEQVTAALVSGTAAYNVAQNLILPAWSYLPLNAAATAGLFKLAARLGLTRDEIGADRSHLGRGIRVGVLLGVVTLIGIGAAVAIPATRSLFKDARVIGVGLGGALFQALIRIPIGTALFEEVLFRGVLLAWLRRRTSTGRAIVGSSVLFGLWHALPAWSTISVYQTGAIRDAGAAASVGVVVGGVILTGMVGAGLAWLRLRTKSLTAPVLVHAVANSASYLGAFAIAHWL
jgi:membrane protease YdiL (CAAX protease family)